MGRTFGDLYIKKTFAIFEKKFDESIYYISYKDYKGEHTLVNNYTLAELAGINHETLHKLAQKWQGIKYIRNGYNFLYWENERWIRGFWDDLAACAILDKLTQ